MPWWLDQAPGMTTISHLAGVWRHVPPGKFEMFDPQRLSAYTAIHNTMLTPAQYSSSLNFKMFLA